MNLDDYSMERLKTPRSAAEFRIATLVRAQGRLEAAFAAKLPTDIKQPLPEIEHPIVIPSIAIVEPVLEPQLDSSGELDISVIRRDIDAAILSQSEDRLDELA